MDANFRAGNFPKLEPTADFADGADQRDKIAGIESEFSPAG
jgi:hypothetical protein